MYSKDFDNWHPKKKNLDARQEEKLPYFKEREIWFCTIGCNVGYEQDGKGKEFWRPVVIVRKYNKHLFFGIPLTSKMKLFPFYFDLGLVDGRAASAVLSQARPFSSKRLVNKIETMNEPLFLSMKKAASDYVFGD